MDPDRRLITGSIACARAIGVAAAALGALVLFGWIAGIASLQTLVPGAVPMEPVTALTFVLVGLALAAEQRSRNLSRVCAAVAAAVTLLTISEHLLHVNLPFERLLLKSLAPSHAADVGSRMAPLAAVTLLCAAMGILLLDWEVSGGRPAQVLALLGGLVAFVGILGYVYHVRGTLQPDSWSTMAIHTGAFAALVSVGVLLSRPAAGFVGEINSPLSGGRNARRVLPAALIFPVLVGYLGMRGQELRLYDARTGLLLVTLVYMAAFFAGIWIASRDLNREAENLRVTMLRDARMAAIVNSSDDAIIGKDLSGVITSWNQGAERLYGYTTEEVVGRHISLLTPSGLEAEIPQFMEQIRRGEPVIHHETKRRRKDGLIRDVVLTISPIRNPQDEIVGAATIAHDVTERKRADEVLRVSEERRQEQARILDLAPVLVHNLDGRIAMWSRGAVKLYGFTSEEAADALVHELLRTQYPESRLEVRRKLMRDGVWEGELTHFTKDNRRVVVASTQVLYYDSGPQPMRVLEVNNDITALKDAEASLIQSQKMQAMGTLAAGIAHDFNNVLQAISGNAAMAASGLPPDHPVQRDLAEIATAGARAMELVRRILAFSRPRETEHVPTEPRPVVEEALKMLRAALPAMIEIDAHLEAVAPISCDPTQLNQLVMNLGTNASHAMGSTGGLLEVSLKQGRAGAELARATPGLWEGPYVVLSITDNGSGMDRATLDRIFDPFFTTKAPGKGTGLGLAVVHGIMKSHGGVVTVESEIGKGTTFKLYFPALENSMVPAARPPRAKVPHGRGQRILVIDDEKAVASLVTRMLQRLEYNVTSFLEASEAIQAFRVDPTSFDVVLSDLALRGMSGLDLAQEFLRVRPLPVVLMSGYFSAEDRTRAESMGIARFLQKPTTLEELGNAMNEVLNKETAQVSGR